jgi:hypothetical protein
MAERERLISLVQRIMDGEFASDAEVDALVAEFERAVVYPGASSLIFWPGDEFDREPTAAEVVDRALSYRTIEL